MFTARRDRALQRGDELGIHLFDPFTGPKAVLGVVLGGG
jgi:hypothetical protein